MWARFKTTNIKMNKKDGKEHINTQRSLNVNEEYFCALRTKSYADFSSKAQVLVNEPSSCHTKFSEILLQPGQDTIATILDSPILSKKYDLKALILDYFDISAEASKICTRLLKSINKIQSNYKFIRQVLDIVDDYSPEELGLKVFELGSFIIPNNPLSNLKRKDFDMIHDKYSLVLNHLKLKKKKVGRKIKFVKFFNKASGVCVTAVCGAVAIAAIFIAAHTLSALLMGPAILSLPLKPLKKKIRSIRVLRSGFLRKVADQLDVAAKGMYILDRDFDTMSRLVSRLHDEIEHNKEMIKFCLDRREDKFSWQVLKEIKKSDVGFRKQVEELEEHVYLCLVTINRARALVIKEITSSCVEDLVH
ncbi:hypothetical protein LguiA_018355 [Lonicera macranthoides]